MPCDGTVALAVRRSIPPNTDYLERCVRPMDVRDSGPGRSLCGSLSNYSNLILVGGYGYENIAVTAIISMFC